MSDKIIISDGKRKHKKDTEPGIREMDAPQAEAVDLDNAPDSSEEQMPLDENVWENDYTMINKLDERTLADRRLFVRIRYLQNVECKTICDHLEAEPVTLLTPLDITISDLSMGGIGIIADTPIETGKILVLPLTLDSILYEVNGQVVYCIRSEDKFRVGLRIVKREKQFIRHLKIFIARISLNSRYGQTSSTEHTDTESASMQKKH